MEHADARRKGVIQMEKVWSTPTKAEFKALVIAAFDYYKTLHPTEVFTDADLPHFINALDLGSEIRVQTLYSGAQIARVDCWTLNWFQWFTFESMVDSDGKVTLVARVLTKFVV